MRRSKRCGSKVLIHAFDYQIEGFQGEYPGDHLLYAGLPVAGLHGDFQSKIWLLEHKPVIDSKNTDFFTEVQCFLIGGL